MSYFNASNECKSIETTNTYLNDETLFRLNKTNKIGDYFTKEIKEGEVMSKKLNKYISAFEYINKTLITLSAITGGTPIITFTSIIGAPKGKASTSFSLILSFNLGIIKKLLNIIRNREKKHNKIVILAKIKLKATETYISQALMKSVISH